MLPNDGISDPPVVAQWAGTSASRPPRIDDSPGVSPSSCSWRYWNRWLNPAEKASPTSLVDVLTTADYTRLVLRNPKAEPARGGTFVYLSVPGALGTDEAHAITVALRGAPPSFASSVKKEFIRQDDVFTVYIKELGPWTRGLRLVAKGAAAASSPESLLVDVDGFYTHVESLRSMMKSGVQRVVVIAGGSGMTSIMGYIQVDE